MGEEENNEYLEDAGRQLNRIFQQCLSDRQVALSPRHLPETDPAYRAPLEESRKWAIYNIINLLFKTYFRLNKTHLSKNILRVIQAYRGDMPSLEAFPMSHQVTFKYYVGVVYFLEEDYAEVRKLTSDDSQLLTLFTQAEKNLTEAWEMCHKDATHNSQSVSTSHIGIL